MIYTDYSANTDEKVYEIVNNILKIRKEHYDSRINWIYAKDGVALNGYIIKNKKKQRNF